MLGFIMRQNQNNEKKLEYLMTYKRASDNLEIAKISIIIIK